MTSAAARLKTLIGAVRIEDVRLVKAAVSTSVRSAEEVGPVTFQVKPAAKAGKRLSDGTFFVTATVDTLLRESGGRRRVAADISGCFELRYKADTKVRTTQKDLQAFAEVNAVYNAWPYWREFIQNMFVRMSLPPLVLPVYRVTDAARQPAAEAARAKRKHRAVSGEG